MIHNKKMLFIHRFCFPAIMGVMIQACFFSRQKTQSNVKFFWLEMHASKEKYELLTKHICLQCASRFLPIRVRTRGHTLYLWFCAACHNSSKRVYIVIYKVEISGFRCSLLRCSLFSFAVWCAFDYLLE